MGYILDLIYLIAALVFAPKLLYKIIRQGRYRSGWSERFGKITRFSLGGKCIWIHAVSVGEVNAARTVIEELRRRFGDYEIVLTATTDTGIERAKALYGGDLQVCYYPLDFSWAVRRAFRRINPDVCLLMELEVWPNFVSLAQAVGVPVIVLNGRLSKKSLSRYRKIRSVARWIFQKLTLVLCQTDEYARRFKEIGVPQDKIVVTGSLKYDTAQIADKVEGADELSAKLALGNTPLWVAGATGNDEEPIILDVYKRLKECDKLNDLRLAIVPRKPERFDGVAQMIKNAGFEFVRYSELKGKSNSEIENRKSEIISAVILGDTMGDLRRFYSVASVIFVGRSLVPMGGSDMLEAGALGKCTIFGPYTFNFNQAVEDLIQGDGAIMVRDKDELFDALEHCLYDSHFASRIAKNGQDVIRQNQGATQRTVREIAKVLNNKQ